MTVSFLLTVLFMVGAAAAESGCKCTPYQTCWPSAEEWSNLNATVSGKLIKTVLPASVCYEPTLDQEACDAIDQEWVDPEFHAEDPTSIDYPIWANASCMPTAYIVDEVPPSNCTIGGYPWYTINATEAEDIQAGLQFATENNIRVVVKTTGHELNGKSVGAFSLNIWMRHFKHGITWSDQYQGCSNATNTNITAWTGSALTIAGGYTCGEVYQAAIANNVIITGGDTPTVSCTGGWMQAGGLGPLTHDYGLGADQVLSAEVVLASGETVTADACQNEDVFFAIRGGGGGTYGIVTSITVKTYPQVSAVAQMLQISMKNTTSAADADALLNATATLFTFYPYLSDNGISGYGGWGLYSPSLIFANLTSGYFHTFAIFNSNQSQVEAIIAPVLAALQPFEAHLNINSTLSTYPDYWSYYGAVSNKTAAVGTSASLTGRLFGSELNSSNYAAIRDMVGILVGTPEEYTSNIITLVGGGKVFSPDTPVSSITPAWRSSYLYHITGRGWIDPSPPDVVQAIRDDITNVKGAAMRNLAPDTGAYPNEADPFEPEWKASFWGANYEKLLAIKTSVDPQGVFYCFACVGSDEWVEDEDGTLCQV